MISRWPGTVYAEAERGRFEISFLKCSKDGWTAIAYTDGDTVRTTEKYKSCDRKAVEEFADQYGLEIV